MELTELVQALTPAVGAGGAAWLALKVRLDGFEQRVMDRFAAIDEDLRQLRRQVARINGDVRKHETAIARLEVQ